VRGPRDRSRGDVEFMGPSAGPACNGTGRGIVDIWPTAVDWSMEREGRLLDVSSLGTIGGGGGASISSTDDIPEGGKNKYFTTDRVQSYLTAQNFGIWVDNPNIVDPALSSVQYGDNIVYKDRIIYHKPIITQYIPGHLITEASVTPVLDTRTEGGGGGGVLM
jgi:hypothetical protein